MTKRILAIVLTVVMAMSVLAVDAFAAFSVSVQKNSAQNAITATWSSVPDAYRYVVDLIRVGGSTNTQYTQNTSYSFNGLSGGTYTVRVTAQNSSGGYLDEARSSEITLDMTGTGSSNKISVTGSGNTTTVTWPIQNGATGYYVSWTGKSSSNSGGFNYSNNNSTTSHVIQVAMSDLASISVYYYDAAGKQVPLDSWTNSTSTTQYDAYISGTTLYWSNPTYQTCYVAATYYNGTTVLTRRSVGTASSFNFGNYINSAYLYSGYPITFTVTNAYGANMGTAVYNGTSSSGTISVTFEGTALKFVAVPGHSYTITASNSTRSTQRTATSTVEYVDISGLISTSSSVTFTVRDNTTGQYGTAVYSPYTYGNGEIWLDGTTVRWYGQGTQNYRVTIYLNSSSGSQVVNTTTSNTYYSFYDVAARYPNSLLYIVVTPLYSGTARSITYYPGNYGYGNYNTNYNFRVTVTSNFNVNVAWDTVPYASTYRVTYRDLTTGSSSRYLDTPFTSANLTLPSGGLYVEVSYYNNNRAYSIGAATISGNGQVNYSGTNTNTNTNTGSTQSGNYVSGVGCSMTVGATSTLVSWNDYYGATRYQVIYTNDATKQARSVTGIYANSYTIPLGYDNTTGGFSVQVIAYSGKNPLGGGPFATAQYKPTTTNNNNTTTKPADTTPDAPTSFKATASNKQVLLSWNAAKNSTSYKVYWKRSSNSTWKLAKETTKRALTIKGLNNDMNYDFKIVASTGVESSVIKIAPTSSGSNTKTADDPKGSTSSSSSKNPVITSATGGNGTFTVSWNGVSGANSYKVYAHRVGVDVTSDGKQTYYCKATVSGTSATVSNLAAGTYQIRIKASTDGGNTWTSLSACDYYTVTVS